MHVYKNTNNFLLDVMPKSGTSNCLADSTKTYYSDGYKKRYSSFTNNWNRETILNLVKTYTNTNYLLDIDMLR